MRVLSKQETWAMAPCNDADTTRLRDRARRKRNTLTRSPCRVCGRAKTANGGGVCDGCLPAPPLPAGNKG